MENLLIVALLFFSLSATALDISCSKDEFELSKKDHQIVEVRLNENIKDQIGYSVTFPRKFKDKEVSSGLLLIGDKNGSKLLASLEITPDFANDENDFIFVSTSSLFNERKFIQITYGSCLSQTIEIK
ncbi:hypothetical protein [Shewanella cyperi]|uniref:hypothetical protein n=1 Tax=Shewanella cyperi TaxID=2814292 RepID=UPI001A9434DA|nr:hypothetical protein [Shewanella cyperi]QSX39455.1 hypothetical protein JYB84_10375 [Shewanella cyperi]